MSIVMGVDQHRAQITAEWIDLATGEPVVRACARLTALGCVGSWGGSPPAAGGGVGGDDWVAVLGRGAAGGRRGGASGRAGEDGALPGNKKRAKSDRADARHHRELLLAGRLPESWIPPDHILDLRAQVRLRHTLIEQHSQWQQRIQAVLYHHGCPHRRQLMVGDGRDWLDAQPLPDTARQQVTVALAVIDALEHEIAPVDREAAGLCAPPDGLPGADQGLLRDRRADRRHRGGRARRLPAVCQQPRRGPLQRPGHHRLSIRPSSRPWTPIPAGAAGAALGAVRGRAGRPPGRTQPRPSVVPRGQGADRRQPCLPGVLARKLLRRCYHTLRELGDEALAPPIEHAHSGPGSAAARHASSGRPRPTDTPATHEAAGALAASTRASAALCRN